MDFTKAHLFELAHLYYDYKATTAKKKPQLTAKVILRHMRISASEDNNSKLLNLQIEVKNAKDHVVTSNQPSRPLINRTRPLVKSEFPTLST